MKQSMYAIKWYSTEGQDDSDYDVFCKVFSKERETTTHNEYEYCKYGDRVFTMAAIMEMEVVA